MPLVVGEGTWQGKNGPNLTHSCMGCELTITTLNLILSGNRYAYGNRRAALSDSQKSDRIL